MELKINDVKAFWNENPLCASGINEELGTKEYFLKYNNLRESNESVSFSYSLHEYPSFKNKKVLDIGCGNGYILSQYAKEGAEVYGIDITETAVELSNKRFDIFRIPFNGGKIQVGNAESLPFDDNTFDCVCSMGVLHHTPDTQQAINEAYRVLKPGGRMIMMFYAKDSLLNKWNFSILKYIHPKYIGMSRQELVNSVDGLKNPKGDIYNYGEMAEMMKKFKHIHMFKGLIQKWMMWPIGYILPQGLLNLFEKKLGWFLYVKGWK
jgi:ubiquinone/menaquinone biosynthesis C-methylase UbiE